MQISLSFLRAFQATSEGIPLTFATNTARALLAYLAVEADRPHPRELVAALLWPDQPQAAAYTNLRQTIARVRKAIPDSTFGAVLEITPQTLQFKRAATTIDVRQFEQLLADCAKHTHVHVTRCQSCLARLQQATALYQGEFLQGLFLEHSQPFEEWVLIKREQLHRQALEALNTLTRAAEGVSDYEQMRQSAQRQLALEPWREEAHGQLMRALALSGERSTALAQYETCCRVLDEELGVGPAPELTALVERIRAGNLTPAMLSAPLPAQNLPAQLTPFVGRERELAEVVTQLQHGREGTPVRLLTLLGAGGMGKTRLAVEAGRVSLDAFPDGVFFVSLAPLTSASPVVPAIATAVGLNLQGSNLRQALFQELRHKRLLLILDNCEHLLDSVELVVELLRAAPQVQILATSRERLGVRAEHVYTLEGLEYARQATFADATTSAAVRLFVQSARRAADFKLSAANLASVLRICQLVQGMPLGLELAAAWVEMLPPDEIATEIERSADFLASDWQDAPERQRSMRAVFEGSWRLLNDTEGRVYTQLAIFRGGFTREAAQAVVGASLRVLAGLVHKSLLRCTEAGRYEIHELLRQFAAEKLTMLSSSALPHEDVRDRHLAFFLAFAEKAEPELEGAHQGIWLERLEAEHDNLHTALRYALASQNSEAGLRLSSALFYFWKNRIYLEEGLGWLKQALALDVDERSSALLPVRLKALIRAGHLALTLGDDGQVSSLCQEALTLAQQLDSKSGSARALFILGGVARGTGNYLQAQGLFAQSLALARDIADHQATAYVLANLGIIAWLQGDTPAAASYVEEGLNISQAIKDDFGVAHLRGDLALIRLSQGDVAAAQSLARACLTGTQAYANKLGEAEALFTLGEVAASQGNWTAADIHYRQSLSLMKENGDKWHIVFCLEGLAAAEKAQGQTGQAVRLWGAAAALRKRANLPLPPIFQDKYACNLVLARSQLGAEAFAVAWDIGHTMTFEQVIDQAVKIAPGGSDDSPRPIFRSHFVNDRL